MPGISLRYTAQLGVYFSDAFAGSRGLGTRKKAFGQCILGFIGVCGIPIYTTKRLIVPIGFPAYYQDKNMGEDQKSD